MPQSPAAMFIESAQDTIAAGKHAGGLKWLQESQVKELHAAVPTTPKSFVDGYVLGLETARAMLVGMPALSLAGIKAEDLL